MIKLLIGFVIGALVGAGAAMTVGNGMMAGIGIATGLSTGICMTVEAAQQMGLMTPEQVDEVLQRAAENLPGGAEATAEAPIAGSAAQCDELLAELRADG